MIYRHMYCVILLTLPLLGWQSSDRPSSFPEKNLNRPTIVPPARPDAERVRAPAKSRRPSSGEKPNSERGRPPAEITANTGEASFYSVSTDGSLTASGEKFSSEELVAAHMQYAFGAHVKVTNLANGKSVVVRIVDRGPYVPGRVLNVSYSAAKELDMIKTGTAQVRLDPVTEHSK
jgi:rare lipoprotein A